MINVHYLDEEATLREDETVANGGARGRQSKFVCAIPMVNNSRLENRSGASSGVIEVERVYYEGNARLSVLTNGHNNRSTPPL
jgi:hypothetical protein